MHPGTPDDVIRPVRRQRRMAALDAHAMLTEKGQTSGRRRSPVAYPRRIRLAPDGAQGPPTLSRMRNAHDARAWFAAEYGNLLAVERHARTHDSRPSAARLAHALAGFLESECHWQDAIDIPQHAADHWSRTGDQPASATPCSASAPITPTADAQAVEAGERALEIARETGDREAEWEAYRNLGVIYWHQGECEMAVALHREGTGDRRDDRKCLE
ncbi:hypothetical protein SANTM175S_11019 [Streptomyces antimycoticus]